MNILRVKRNKIKTKLYGGEEALIKHGLTAELLTTKAWECQQKVGYVVDSMTWQNSKEPESDPLFSAQCVFALPVCDLTNADIRHARDQGAGTLSACRSVGRLQI